MCPWTGPSALSPTRPLDPVYSEVVSAVVPWTALGLSGQRILVDLQDLMDQDRRRLPAPQPLLVPRSPLQLAGLRH